MKTTNFYNGCRITRRDFTQSRYLATLLTFSTLLITTSCEFLTNTQKFTSQKLFSETDPEITDAPLSVTPGSANALAGQGVQLIASGGRPPYTWSILNGGSGDILPSGHFLAPNQAANTLVQVQDVDGNQVSATISTTLRPQLQTPNDTLFPQLWALQSTASPNGFDSDIDAREGWLAGNIQDCTSLVIAVVDSGITLNHPDLAPNLWINVDEVPGNGVDDDVNGFVDDINGFDFVNNDANPSDDNFHGTHVSGTIAAVGNNSQGVTGVCWRARIMSVKIADQNGDINTMDAAQGIAYAWQNGAFLSNHSWGGTGSDPLIASAVQTARNNGHLMIAAAGNAPINTDLPGNLGVLTGINTDNLISVAASRESDNQLASFSSFGTQTVDLVAPGELIRSTFPTTITPGITALANQLGVNPSTLLNFATISGTSMATPQVSGAAALLKAKNPNFTYTQVRDLILSRVEKIPQFVGRVATGGRLDLFNLLGAYFQKPAILEILSAIITDPGNNGPQANETIIISPTLMNLGDAIANGSTVTFASSSTAIQLQSPAVVSAGTVAAGALIQSVQYSVRILAGTPVGTNIPFTFTTSFSGGFNLTTSGALIVQ